MAAGVRDVEHAILPAEARRLAKAGGYELCRAAILVKGPDGVRSGVGDVDLDAVGGEAGGQFKAVERGVDLAGIEVEVAQSAVAAVADAIKYSFEPRPASPEPRVSSRPEQQ